MKRSLFALALAAALPMSAQAADDGVSFTYVEADYVNADVPGLDSMNGFAARGNVGFAEHWYGTASWSKVDKGDVDLGFPEGPVDIDFEESTIGVGFHTAIATRTQFLAELAYVNERLNVEIPSYGNGTDSTHGYRASAGLRAMLGSRFEGEVKAHYTDLNDIDSGFGGEINGMFAINPTWGITAGWQTDDYGGDNIDQWKLGVRASF
jgi:opacity protein-like surface antigen